MSNSLRTEVARVARNISAPKANQFGVELAQIIARQCGSDVNSADLALAWIDLRTKTNLRDTSVLLT